MQLVPYEIYKKCFSSVNEDENQTGSFNFHELLASTEIGGMNDKFNINIDDSWYYDEMIKYCHEHQDTFSYVNEGSSRIVFLMKDGRCLKIAKNEAGLSQNKRECRTFSMRGIDKYNCFPKLFDADKKMYRALIEEFGTELPESWVKQHFNGHEFWEIMKLVKVIYDISRVKRCKKEDSINALKDVIETGEVPAELQGVSQFKHNAVFPDLKKLEHDYRANLAGMYDAFFNPKNKEIIKPFLGLLDFYQDHGTKSLIIDDLEQSGNWALCHRNGEDVPVIIDAGLSDSVWNKHYS